MILNLLTLRDKINKYNIVIHAYQKANNNNTQESVCDNVCYNEIVTVVKEVPTATY